MHDNDTLLLYVKDIGYFHPTQLTKNNFSKLNLLADILNLVAFTHHL